ncbi:MAG: transcriptional repressor LexA [Myxococcales bacterium]|nr:transcriptional repressor LexA [Myxococcales bacterium]MCZ6823550.1 transcriptional repressor LexA [Deltaproteobacteria bacterium]TDJ02927.1 MAG: transcriptional repressor LexA [Deltaproteobacteria bacterium]
MHLTRRQREVFDFIREYLEREGYAPSLEEIGLRFGLSSVATVHKHVQNLVEKGLLRKAWNRSRSLEIVDPASTAARVIPLLGTVAAGAPIEAVATPDTISVPADLIGRKECYALRVSGDSMVDDHIVDGDVVLLESRSIPHEGETVVALIRREEATLKRFYRNGSKVRLVPSNSNLQPMEFAAEDVEVQGVVIGLLRRF